MSFFRQREKPFIVRRQALDGVPVLNSGVDLRTDGGGHAMLRATGSSRVGWMNRFRPAVDSRRFELDEFGAYVVGLIDGRRTVMDIVDCFQGHFGLSRRESELGVVAFVKLLMQRHLLSVGIGSIVTDGGPS